MLGETAASNPRSGFLIKAKQTVLSSHHDLKGIHRLAIDLTMENAVQPIKVNEDHHNATKAVVSGNGFQVVLRETIQRKTCKEFGILLLMD